MLPVIALCLWGCDGGKAETAEAILTPARRAIDHAQRSAAPPVEVPEEKVEAAPLTEDGPEGYVAMTPSARSGDFGNAVLLAHPDDDVVVPIFIGGTEALSIQLRLEERPFRRPLTHDLLDTFAKKMGARLVRSQVNALVDDVYVGSVVFEHEGELVELDARPSDAIALAIGNHVPIFVAKAVIEHAGVRIDDMGRARPKPRAEPVAL